MKDTSENRAELQRMQQEANNATPIALWGRDHWSTFSYIGYVIVHYQGVPTKARMRTDADLHPGLIGAQQLRGIQYRDTKHPTRLKGGIELDDHDDWSCVEDMVGLGLVEWNGTGMHPKFDFTKVGWTLHERVEKYLAAGGQLATLAEEKL